MAEKSSPHAGHRERMRKRLMSSSSAVFADHEILEMLLYYTNARGDTNETAHALIEAFGSLEGVLDADPDRLQSVWGIGESASVLFTLLGELSRRYMIQKMSGAGKPDAVLDSPEKLVSFFLPHFIGATKELVYALLLDNSMRPLDCFPVGDGTVSSVILSVRSIAERAYTKHAAAVVLAHNHPGGIAVPSSEDIQVTHHLREALSLLGITLVDHFVLSDRSFAPILSKIDIKTEEAVAASPIFDLIKSNFKQKKGDRS
ncbi:MAG: DNA repair protein RadC [Clostridia bacterium]|nr:DNA repair protein RadC [Clostridia bacterium]